MLRWIPVTWTAVLFGCGPKDLTGEERGWMGGDERAEDASGGEDDGGGEPDSGDASDSGVVSDLVIGALAAEITEDGSGRPDPLVLVGDQGQIQVEHYDLTFNCGATIGGQAVLSEDTITVTYSQTDGSTDECIYVLTYTIEAVPAGTWTVTAAGDSAEVVVE